MSSVTLRPAFFGARASADATQFKLWAPEAPSATLVVDSGAHTGEHAMTREDDGTFTARIGGIRPGDLYRFRVGDSPAMPDPASRFQPLGVHGPSEVIDPAEYRWSDAGWPGVSAERAVIYELHVGAFTPEGTFSAAAARLPYLRDLGISVVELMPVAEFAGGRNWGYDGACLYAPSRAYGRPDDLRRFVDAAHRLGVAVMLDVVYNHLGPDGAYVAAFAPAFLASRHASAWGAGVNLDGDGSEMVRSFILNNARHWFTEYHFDGLRLDATHALVDDSPVHIVPAIVAEARRVAERPLLIVAEDHRNDVVMLRDPSQGGWGLDGVWADDFHHIMRRILAGDSEGYYEDFDASVTDLATTLRTGWFFTGQHSKHLGEPRGTDPSGVPRRKFVICLQNHDQIGNRAFGDRLNQAIDGASYRAASALLLLAPETPLLFMGQEWAASSPFRYFTDHHAALGRDIIKGRRQEFGRFSEFRDPEVRRRIPSPQDPTTFEASRLRWEERDAGAHAAILRLYRRLLELRRRTLTIAPDARDAADAASLDDDTLLLWYGEPARVWIVVRLRGSGAVELPDLPAGARVVLTTEDAAFAPEGHPPELAGRILTFAGPAAVILSSPARLRRANAPRREAGRTPRRGKGPRRKA